MAGVKKVRRLKDAYVTVEFSFVRYRGDTERYAKDLERACTEFEEFLRDHRSQDASLYQVKRVFRDECSGCGHEWETMHEWADKERCANCGEAVERAP